MVITSVDYTWLMCLYPTVSVWCSICVYVCVFSYLGSRSVSCVLPTCCIHSYQVIQSWSNCSPFTVSRSWCIFNAICTYRHSLYLTKYTVYACTYVYTSGLYVCTTFCIRTNDSIESVPQIASWFSRMHAVLIGPGLGRSKDCLETAKVSQPINHSLLGKSWYYIYSILVGYRV